MGGELKAGPGQLYASVQSSTIRNGQKVETTQAPTNKQVDKRNAVVHGQCHVTQSRRHATTRMSLEDVTLSELSQTRKDECCMIPLT